MICVGGDFPKPPSAAGCSSLATLARGITELTGAGNKLGVGLFSQLSGVNHSCSPNGHQSFVTGRNNRMPSLNIFSTRRINANEEVTVAYCDLGAPTDVRQKELLGTYFFNCNCSKCQLPVDSTYLSTYNKCVENESKVLNLIDTGKYLSCLPILRAMTPSVETVWGRHSTQWGLHLLKIVKISLLQEEGEFNQEEIQNFIVEAKGIFEKLFGPGNEIEIMIRENYAI